MNIFYIHTDPKMCAEWAVDSHCVKMILESAQLLSTAHRLLDGDMYIDASSAQTIKTNLRKLLKRADDSVKGITRVQPAEVRKVFRDRARGKMVDGVEVEEENGAGFIGTTGLRKKYQKATPGQQDSKLAVDGVPTKDGIKKPRV